MSDLAKQLIAENKRTKDKFLDLGNCGLSEIPAELTELVWLEALSLASVWGESDKKSGQRKQSRNVGGRNTLTDVGPLAALSALKELYISLTGVSDLGPLAGMSSLTMLDIWGTPVSDFAPLVRLSNLQMLLAYSTGVTDLAPLACLSNLQKLDVSCTKISDLTPLTGLSALRMLDVSFTRVTELAPLACLSGLKAINVDGCPLKNPPAEIVRQGSKAILNFLHELAGGEIDHLYEAKMLIVGAGGAGKTSLLRRLYQPDQPLPKESETTKGIAIYRHEFRLKKGQLFRLNVWDFGGQEIYHATHQFFLTRRSLYLLVDDTRKDDKSVSDEGFKYWLELIDVFGGHSPTLIFQNEKGGRSKQIDIPGIKGHYDNVQDVYRGNLEHPGAANKVHEGIEFYASHLSHIGEELPTRWIRVRADIEVRARKAPTISQQEYFEIYSRHMEFDRSKALHLSRYLHDLGVFLHFQDDPLLARTVILQNEWATEAVFRILDDEIVKAKWGRFTREDCGRLWKDSNYGDMHPELLALMERFELCYELRDSQLPTWLAPQLLPAAKPTDLTEWDKPGDLVLRYRYEFLPKGMISRLTVRLHRYVCNPEMAWVTGVLFEDNGTSVLVEKLTNGSEIELRVRGPRAEILRDIVAADLDALNDSFKGLRNRVDKRIPCNCKECCTAAVPEFFDQRDLLRRRQNGRIMVECPRSYKEVSVSKLLGIKLDHPPGWVNSESTVATPCDFRIFLASSSGLEKERNELVLYLLEQQADRLRRNGFDLKIVRWENFFNAIAETRMQDEYNQAIRECDAFVSVFRTKVGKFTEEEFDVAHDQFKSSGAPHIYTFFEKAQVDIDELPPQDFASLQAFKTKLKSLGHYPTKYDDLADLKLQFQNQLDKILERLRAQQKAGTRPAST